MNITAKFIKIEAASAKLLFAMTLLALIICHSPWKFYYDLLRSPLSFYIGNISFQFDALFWVNDGLMTLFFLIVGLEIKYEMLYGHLNTRKKAILPGIAAVGGMLVPAAIFSILNYHDPIALRGWAIPAATDIAFSLAILSLLIHKAPAPLKSFLMALAIFDDLGAILIIAIFYNDHVSLMFLELTLACIAALIILNFIRVSWLSIYFIVGVALWVCLLKSGVHPTITGVILAAFIPFNPKHFKVSPLEKLKNRLHPIIALGILPLFALVNSGVSFTQFVLEDFQWTCFLGVTMGLFIGKQIGVLGMCWVAVKLGWAKLPEQMQWSDVYGMSILCGVGFTMSLFINALAFEPILGGLSFLNAAKMGILVGSLLSGLIGYLYLSLHKRVGM